MASALARNIIKNLALCRIRFLLQHASSATVGDDNNVRPARGLYTLVLLFNGHVIVMKYDIAFVIIVVSNYSVRLQLAEFTEGVIGSPDKRLIRWYFRRGIDAGHRNQLPLNAKLFQRLTIQIDVAS
jgi:hypothetical protein